MQTNNVAGMNKGHILLYALSTCGWCKKTKLLLQELGVEYNYIDVDLLKGDEQTRVIEQVTKWNPKCSFPVIVLNNKKSFIGYQPDELRKELEQ